MLDFPATVPPHLLSKNRQTSKKEAQTKASIESARLCQCQQTLRKNRQKQKKNPPLGVTISNKSHDQRSATHCLIFNFTILLNTRAVCTWCEIRTSELHACECFCYALFSRKSYEKSYETRAIRKRKKDKRYRDGSLHGLFLKTDFKRRMTKFNECVLSELKN